MSCTLDSGYVVVQGSTVLNSEESFENSLSLFGLSIDKCHHKKYHLNSKVLFAETRELEVGAVPSTALAAA